MSQKWVEKGGKCSRSTAIFSLAFSDPILPPTLKTALQWKNAEMQELTKVVRVGIGTTPGQKSAPKGGFSQNETLQDPPKMGNRSRVVFCFPTVSSKMFGRSFLDNPHLKLPNKQLNTGRGGKRTSMAAARSSRSSERVTWVK